MTASDGHQANMKELDISGFETVLKEELDLLSRLRCDLKIPSFRRALNVKLDDQVKKLRHDDKCDLENHVYQSARNFNLAGLAFSGGGIRSATFNLGVIQALAKYGLLSKFDYLSTVSGGGFIGGWLSALLNRKARGNENEIKVVHRKMVEHFQSCLKTHPDDALACDEDKNAGFEPVEHLAVRHLRRHSNYLTPRLGLSGDTLAIVTIFIRNFTLIQLTLISLVASVLVFAHLIAVGSTLFALQGSLVRSGLQRVGNYLEIGSADWLGFLGDFLSANWPFVGSALLLFFAFWSAGRMLGERTEQDKNTKEEDKRQATDHGSQNKLAIFWGRFKTWVAKHQIFLNVILPTVMAAWWFSAAAVLRYQFSQEMDFYENGLLHEAFYWAGCGIVSYGLAWIVGYGGLKYKRRNLPESSAYETCKTPNAAPVRNGLDRVLGHLGVRSKRKKTLGDEISAAPEEDCTLLKIIVFAIFSGALFGLLLLVVAYQVTKISSSSPINLWQAVAFFPPLLILGLSFIVTVHIGMAQRSFTEEEREWLARLGGLVLFAAAAWVLPFVLILYATPFVDWLAGGGIAALVTWAAGSGAGAWLARGPSTGTKQGGTERKDVWKDVITLLAPWLFVIGLGVIVAHLTHIAMVQALTPDGYVPAHGTDFSVAASCALSQLNNLPLQGTLSAFLLIVAVFLLIAWRLDLNLFSLHALYCNRLGRAYLGASRVGKRNPNPFSGFDVKDDLKFCELAKQRPIPIINTAINMTGGDELAWQTRRAASFAFTPRWSGYETRDSQGKKIGKYRPTSRYARNRNLGTLMAISGAAASPNMGYHTSPAVAALMTAFNLRLGRWCGNPERNTWETISPKFAVKPIFAELAGSANAQADWINLTDGGHFDNLGVYELIRRRCRLIVVTDAGCDPKHYFEDLANTLRKCWTDLGVNIRFDQFEQVHLKKDSRYSATHDAVGRIQYHDDGPEGVIIYLKSSMIGDEWPDIGQYADTHKDFPHETTSDQFFDENQFEAYRHLGYKVAAKMAKSLMVIRSDLNSLTIEEIASRLVPPDPGKNPGYREWPFH